MTHRPRPFRSQRFARAVSLGLVTCALSALALTVPTGARQQASTVTALPNFDVRLDAKAAGAYLARTAAAPDGELARTRIAGVARLSSDVAELHLDASPLVQAPEVIGRALGAGYLTPPAADRVAALRGFLAQYADAFGATAQDVAELEVVADYVNPAGNMGWVELQQRVNGLPVFQGTVRGGFTAKGELARTTGVVVPAAAARGAATAPAFGAADAVARAAESVGWKVSAARAETAVADGKITLEQGEMAAAPRAWLTYFPLANGALRLAWMTEIWGNPDVYMVVLDAETGDTLFRKYATFSQTQSVTYNVYTSDSPAPFSPSTSTPTAPVQAPYVTRTTITRIGNEAPYTFNSLGWITDGQNTTAGNNVIAGIDRDGVNGVDAPITGSGSRVFTFDYKPGGAADPNAGAGTNDPLNASFQAGDVTNMFYQVNRYHDELYLLGFTEAARNFQNDNFGRGGIGNDRISAEGQDSSGANNANFSIVADGSSGRMQMFLWTGPTPDYSGDLDQEVIFHELTHGLSQRLHANASGLATNMAAGMGEGWSDFYARSLLSTAGENVNGVYQTGGWATHLIQAGFEANYYYGIRRFPYAPRALVGPNGRPHSPLTFADIDSTKADLSDGAFPRGPIGVAQFDQVHNIGEVWAGMLLEVRARLINRLGWAQGNQSMLQWVTDGMKLDPAGPTMLQARDAILAAAQAGGATPADIEDIWRGFATRGLGVTATIENAGTGGNTTRVTESFLTPGDPVPALSIDDVSASEGNAGTKTFTFTVRLANPSAGSASVSWATANGTATSAGVLSTFSSGGVTINDNTAATPYPVAFNVAGVAGTIQNVAVRLNGLSHTYPGDIDALLVGPGGQMSMFMSDVGTGDDLVGATITFRDGFAPATTAGLASGSTYGPANLDTASDAMPAPAPAQPGDGYPAPLSVFSGLNANGTWAIYLRDDAGVDVGSIASIDLLITVPSLSTDYLEGSGTLTFAPGETSKALDVTVNGDAVTEPSETFVVNLSYAAGAVINDAQGVGTIVNDDSGVPFTVDDSYAVSAGTVLNAAAPGVLANDVDGSAPMTAALVASPSHGNVTLNGDGSFSYVPAPGYVGADSFTYRATNAFGAGNISTVALSVDAGTPTTADDAYAASYMTALAVGAPGVLANDSPNGSALSSALLVSGTANGTLALAGNGSFTYTPDEDFAGTDSFTYRAVNGVGQGTTGTVTIAVAQPTTTQHPKQLYVASVVGTRVTLRWKAPVVGPTPTGYVLEGGIAPGETLAAIPTGLDAPIFTFDAPSGSFFVRMKTVGSGGTSIASNDVPLHVNVPVPPSAPEGLVAGVGGSALNLVWRNTFGGGPATGMVLDVSGAVNASVPLGLTESFSVPVVPDGTYTFAVRPINGGGSGPASAPVTISFPVSAPGFPSGCNAAPLTPTNVLAYRAGNTVSIVWDPAGTGTAPSGFVLNVTSAVITGSFPVSGRSVSSPAPSGSYTLTLQAVNGCGASAPTVPQTVVIP